jgi:hypothetical protein
MWLQIALGKRPVNVRRNHLQSDAFIQPKRNGYAHKEDTMLNKVTMINAVWMVIMTGMIAATVTLYDQKVDASKVYGPYASARTAVMSQY